MLYLVSDWSCLLSLSDVHGPLNAQSLKLEPENDTGCMGRLSTVKMTETYAPLQQEHHIVLEPGCSFTCVLDNLRIGNLLAYDTIHRMASKLARQRSPACYHHVHPPRVA